MKTEYWASADEIPQIEPPSHAMFEQPEKRPALTLRHPGEILEMAFDDSDIILGERLLAAGQSLVIAAAGGIGKSRLLLQLIASIVAARKFLKFNTGGARLKWLVLQTENSNRRLKHDLAKLRGWMRDDWAAFNDQVFIHTIETDSDCFVSLDSTENQASILAAIEASKPDVIAVDPLNDFAVGDLNKDGDMKQTLVALTRICRKGNPNRAILALHHALTGKSGAARATGYDRSSFARNSKVLFAWARGMINLAPVDADNNDRLIVACGKCSNGREFQPFAIRLDLESLIYECDATVDVKHWESEMAGKTNGATIAPERVRELCKPLSTKAELAKAITNDCGCVRGSAYRFIKRAEQVRMIAFNKANETYSPK